MSELSNERRRSIFFENLAQLKKSCLDKPRVRASEKIGKIDNFVKNHTREIYKDKEFDVEFKQLADQRASLERENEWELFIAEVDSLHRPKTEGANADKELQLFRSKCEQMKEDMNLKFGKRAEFAPRVTEVQGKLDKFIADVDNLIGDGSWKNVLEFQKRYYAEPSDENIKRYRKVLTSFDVNRKGNLRFKDEQEKGLKALNEDCGNKKEYLDARMEFKRSPNAASFEKLRSATVRFWRSRKDKDGKDIINTKEIEPMYNWVVGVQGGSIVIESPIQWVGYDFEKSGLQTWFGDNEVKLFVNGFEVGGLCKVRANKWRRTDGTHRNYGNASIESGFSFKLDGAGVTQAPEEMKILVINFGCQPDRSGDGSISFWELVAKETSSFEHVVSLNCHQVPKKDGVRDATITLHFSGVNVCP